MRIRPCLFSLLPLCIGLLALPLRVTACQAVPLSPARLLTDAEVIVRVTAIGYTKSPAEGFWTTGVPEATIEFRVEEMLKGEATAPVTLTVNGYLNDRDDFNDRPVPYDFIRPGGRAGSCIANSYKKGAEFLFFLKKREGRGNRCREGAAKTGPVLFS